MNEEELAARFRELSAAPARNLPPPRGVALRVWLIANWKRLCLAALLVLAISIGHWVLTPIMWATFQKHPGETLLVVVYFLGVAVFVGMADLDTE
ncbi:MAG: hypothetical protein AAFU77_10710 [Myxococcota bacterium]